MSDVTDKDLSEDLPEEREMGASRELQRTGPESPLSTYPGGRAELIGETTRGRSFFDRLPWEKALIWGLIFLAVYMMRGFFFTIFMTFMVSYIIRSLVMRAQGVISPYTERIWLERVLTLACFALLLFAIFEAGKYIGPKLKDQAEALYARVTHLNLEKEYNAVLVSTVGQILFEREYGDRDDERYQKAFAAFQEEGGLRVVDMTNFGKLRESLEVPFKVKIRDEARDRVEQRIKDAEIPKGEEVPSEFRTWLREAKAPEILAENENEWFEKWEAKSRIIGANALEVLKSQLDYKEIRRGSTLELITTEWLDDQAKRDSAFREWKEHLVEAEVAAAMKAPATTQRFKEEYEARRAEDPGRFPYDYTTYMALCKAHEEGEKAFSALLQSIDNLTETIPEDELLAKQHRDFQLSERERLIAEWQQTPTFARIKEYVQENLSGVVGGLENWLKKTFRQVIALPAQVALVILLSLFITLDFHKLRAGVHRLENSRVRNFYLEIAPGLINFGRLIGRAFLAQGVIAFFNTVLTFLAIRVLDIQNEYFLCTVVFLCSFIPVAGVVLSSAPIAIMAMIQDGGSFWLAVQAILAILIIHFIETSLLNPKILGDMLHLHPVLVLTVLAVGQQFFGVWGLLLAVPVAVYIIRFVILNEGIPGLIEIEPTRGGRSYAPASATASAAASSPEASSPETPAPAETFTPRTPASGSSGPSAPSSAASPPDRSGPDTVDEASPLAGGSEGATDPVTVSAEASEKKEES